MSSGKESADQKVPAQLARVMSVTRVLPLGSLGGSAEYRHYKHDCLAFSWALLPELIRRKIDVIHVIDYPLTIHLLHLRRLFRYRTRVVFSDGGLMPPQYYPKADHIHHVAQVQFEAALASGIPHDRMTVIPCGLHCSQFSAAPDRQRVRTAHGISDGTFVILVVAALNRSHKRVDHVIEEVSRVEGDILLWIDGRLEDPTIVDLAREKLGPRCRISHIPTKEVSDLYRLADVFVHGALEEGFGLAITEAASAGLKVLAHDSPHFEWLLGDRECLLDMRVSGALAHRLQQLVGSRSALPYRNGQLAASIRARFDWDSLGSTYIEMYRKVAANAAFGGQLS